MFKPTRLVDFENIAKQFKVNIRLIELAGESVTAEESETVWKLVFGKNQFRKNLPCVDIGFFVNEDHDRAERGGEQSEKERERGDSGAGASQADKRDSRQGHCFFIKDIELLTKLWECGGCKQRFNRHDNYNRHVTGGTCGGGKTKLICPGGKFERIMNSTEIVFYGGKKEFQLCRMSVA